MVYTLHGCAPLPVEEVNTHELYGWLYIVKNVIVTNLVPKFAHQNELKTIPSNVCILLYFEK